MSQLVMKLAVDDEYQKRHGFKTNVVWGEGHVPGGREVPKLSRSFWYIVDKYVRRKPVYPLGLWWQAQLRRANLMVREGAEDHNQWVSEVFRNVDGVVVPAGLDRGFIA
jgi:hypothetical protein